MDLIKKWIETHPNLWEFIKFNILSNVATIVNFIVMWIATAVFSGFGWHLLSFKFLIFNYVDNIEQNLGLAGFLSFLIATALAQTVNFFVQKQFVFKSNAAFKDAIPKYIILAIALVIISAALPAYSQKFFRDIGIGASIVPTLANALNIIVQVVISYPTMKYIVMPEKKKQK